MSVHLILLRHRSILSSITLYPSLAVTARLTGTSSSQFKNPIYIQCRTFSTESLIKAMSATKLSDVCPDTPTIGSLQCESDVSYQWREYFDHTHKIPYYHNLRTDEITNKKPINFDSKFGDHYHNRALIGNGGNEKVCSDAPGKLGLKSKLALYGGGGLLLYLVIHNLCLVAVFISLYLLEIDLFKLAEKFSSKFKRKETGEMKNRSLIGTFVPAVAFNKILVPAQITVTLMLAPILAPRLQPFATKLSAKFWSMKSAVGF